jgi:choline dehydrogenase-like flavoprotein
VLANRLSANPSVKVLLLERGARHDGIGTGSVILTHAPFGIVPSKAIKLTPSAQLNQRQQDVYEALSLGGRTRINAGLYLQGCPAEYESWGEGWQWKDVEPFFKRQEGRLELEKYNDSRKTLDHEGGEWKTRVVDAEYESSRQYVSSWRVLTEDTKLL